MCLCALHCEKIKYRINSYTTCTCIQSRDNDDNKGANGLPGTKRALIAVPLAGFRNVSIANTDETVRKQ